MSERSPGGFPSTSESSRRRVARPPRAPGGDAEALTADGKLHGQGLVTRSDRAAERQQLEVDMAVALVLPALGVDPLLDVALAVEEADADERDAEVGGALQVIPGERAEAARVDGDRLVQRELGREVRDRPRVEHAARRLAPGPGVAADELLGRQGGEEGDRVVVHLTPEVGIEVTEDADHLGLPCPQEIARQLIQPRGKRGGRRLHHSSSKAWAERSAHDSGRSLAVGTSQASGSPPGGW